MVTGTKKKEVKQKKKKMRIHQDRNQVLKIKMGAREKSMVIMLRA